MADKLFPYATIKSVRTYYLLTALLNCYFIAGVWFFVWRHSMSITQIGVSDGLTFGAGFLFELPSGVWADLVGRRLAVILGFAGLAVGNFAVTFSYSFLTVTVSYLIWTLGYTFQSGALDALVYDDLLTNPDIDVETAWPHIISRAQVYAKSMTLLCTLLGGLTYVLWFRLPWLLMSFTSLLALLVTFSLPREPGHERQHKLWHRAAYTGKIGQGIGVVFQKRLRVVAGLAMLVGALDYALSWGILRPLVGVRFGFTAASLPVLQVIASVAVVFTLIAAGRIMRTYRNPGIVIGAGALLYGVSFIVMGLTRRMLFGASVFVLIEITSAVIAVALSIYVNRHTLSAHRATSLSTVSLLQRTPYAFLAALLGWLGSHGLIGAFCVVAGGVIAGLTALLLPKWSSQDTSVRV